MWKKILVWNGIWNGRFLFGMEMKWKKVASMEYGKIVFHSIPYHALAVNTNFSAVWFDPTGNQN